MQFCILIFLNNPVQNVFVLFVAKKYFEFLKNLHISYFINVDSEQLE
jgi:hypothetical protein